MSPLQQDEGQSSKNLITSDNLKIPLLGGFNLILANPIEDKDITKVAKGFLTFSGGIEM